ncbi:MAG: cobyric acid synthase [Acidimicrobiia bacterium]
MVQGTTSWAGKSLLATALCRALSRRGLTVAPFKAQNMSNNARVVDGGEIGCAQYFQALAARCTPHVDHNPILLKPEADTRSQVVVLGSVDRELTEAPWRGRSSRLWPIVTAAYGRVAATADVVVIEGAGSPAETNLAADDIVNMAMADHADARVLLVTDIDRGGAFAHLYGTWALLPPNQRGRIDGFVLNKFRGDPGLLAPAPADLEALTGVPTIGVLPMVHHDLPDEDGAAWDLRPSGADGAVRVRIVRGPAASNLDEFWLLRQVADVRWATTAAELDDAELIVLPGSKLTSTDVAWMRSRGLDDAVRAGARRGARVVGVCGGAQMMGLAVDDPHGLEAACTGLGLLPLRTELAPIKTVRRTTAAFSDLPAQWSTLHGMTVSGYEIHHGITRFASEVSEASEAGAHRVTTAVLPSGLGWAAGSLLAMYLHGCFEDPEFVERLVGRRPVDQLEPTFEALADLVDEHLDLTTVLSRAGVVDATGET